MSAVATGLRRLRGFRVPLGLGRVRGRTCGFSPDVEAS